MHGCFDLREESIRLIEKREGFDFQGGGSTTELMMSPAIAPSIPRTSWANPYLSIVAHERRVAPALLHAVVFLLLQTPLFDASRRLGLHPALGHLRRPTDQMG